MRHVGLAQPVGVEDLPQTGDGAVMEIVTAVPETFERWDFIVNCALRVFSANPGSVSTDRARMSRVDRYLYAFGLQ
jgi:hypothetical protein